ncbi:MAG: hypothetical protein ACYCZH_15150 [Sulfuriferula sp.]
MTEQFLKFLGEIAAYGGGAALVSYLLFQHLGKTWIENKFAQRLDQFKHQQALELQRLRVEIDSLLSGALKLQEREFQILPEAWQKLDEAHGLVSWLVSPMQEYPNLDRMTAPQLEEYLAGTEFTHTQKEELRSSRYKVTAYQEIIFWYRLHKVKKASADLQNFVARNGIFFPIDLKEKFSKITESLWSAVISKEVGHEAKDYNIQNEGWKKIKEETEPLYKSIETDIQVRLQSHGRKP